MTYAEAYKRIEGLESMIAYAVLRGEMEWARDLATSLATVRDSMQTTDELMASVHAR